MQAEAAEDVADAPVYSCTACLCLHSEMHDRRCMTDGAALGHVTALQARAAHSCSLCAVFMLWLEQVAALA